jgi:lipoprotein-releasing system ATP-binding protein
MSEQTQVLQCRDLSKTYREGPQSVDVLKSIDLSVAEGESIAIIGASGSGKSTLLNLLGGLDKPCHGEVFVREQAFSSLNDNQRGAIRNSSLGFVYQFHHLLPEFSALENVCMPLLIGKVSPAESKRRANEILSAVGLAARASHKPAELSGGERQRVAIARALVSNPACVLMDEPTGNLDQHTADDIQQLMLSLNRDYKTSFIVVTHDHALAAKMDRVFVLNEGVLSEKSLVQDNV